MALRERNRTAGRWLVALSVLGIASAVGLFANNGLDVDGVPGAAWLIAVVVLAVALAVGLVVRESNPARSTVLLTVGAAAPAVAWYNLPPSYVLSLGIVAVALMTRPRPGPRPVSS